MSDRHSWVDCFVLWVVGCCISSIPIAGCYRANTSFHSLHYRGQLTEIKTTSVGYLGVVMTDSEGFAIPLTVQQANSVKTGARVEFDLVFNGWGTCQRTENLHTIQ